MNQRIAVRAIIKQGNELLFIRRADGRVSILGKYELPGGKIGYGEQPEDALRRYLHEQVGIHIKTAQLFDVVTYIDHDDRDIQYAIVVKVIVNGIRNAICILVLAFIYKTIFIPIGISVGS